MTSKYHDYLYELDILNKPIDRIHALYCSCVREAESVFNIYEAYASARGALMECGCERVTAESILRNVELPAPTCEEVPEQWETLETWDEDHVLYWDEDTCRLEKIPFAAWNAEQRELEHQLELQQEREYHFLRSWER